jgi:serine protease Do
MSLRKALLGATAGALTLAGVAGGLAIAQPAFLHDARAAQAVGPQTSNWEHPGSFADLVERASPSVVTVLSKTEVTAENQPFAGSPFENLPEGSPFRDFFKQFGMPGGPMQGGPQQQQEPRVGRALGSGFIVDGSGYIVTNNHVIDHATEIKVALQDGSEYPAELVGRDEKTDLALLKIEAERDLPALAWADSDAARVGDWVVAIGNPFGIGSSVSAGIISARGRDIHAGPYDDFIQVDAAINRGNSGGPLFTEEGSVVGVNTAILSPSGGNIGLGFAIPANQAKAVIAQLKEDGSVERGWIGVSIQPVTPELADGLGLKEPKGALVAEVQPDSPAQKAGIQQGDVILDFAGKPIGELRDLTRGVAASKVGASQELKVWRNGEEQSLSIAPARMEQTAAINEMPGEPGVAELPELGLTLGQADPAGSGQGVLVTGVEPGAAAEESGLRPGDRILAIDQQPVSNPEGAKQAIAKAEGAAKKSLLLLVEQQGRQHYLALSLKA